MNGAANSEVVSSVLVNKLVSYIFLEWKFLSFNSHEKWTFQKN